MTAVVTASSPVETSAPASDAVKYVLRRVGGTVLTVVISGIILLILWQLALIVLHPTAFVAKNPFDVYKYLFVDNPLSQTDAAQNRASLIKLLWVTLGHAAVGFFCGVGASIVIAMLFTLVRPIEFMFMPIAMLARTVPLLAMAPIIYMIFGNGLPTAALVGVVVTFFPVLVNLSLGFRSASHQSVDLIRVYGGGRLTVMFKVAVPSALPHFFASMRIAVPHAITGAMLYEWLWTYQGLGAAITSATSLSDYPRVWTIAVFITVVSIVLYTITTIIEAAVLAKWGPNAGRATGR